MMAPIWTALQIGTQNGSRGIELQGEQWNGKTSASRKGRMRMKSDHITRVSNDEVYIAIQRIQRPSALDWSSASGRGSRVEHG